MARGYRARTRPGGDAVKILSLTAENLKRIIAVQITPDGAPVVVIAGRNGQGKTSVLDSIWFALGGGPAIRNTVKPIREGEDHASVRLDLGDIVVTRTWQGTAKSTLVVENGEGARFPSPQALLDGLVGRLSFDPLAFAQQDERTQLASLLELVELPFDPDELDAKRRGLYEQRTDVGRVGKQLAGQLAGIPKPAAGTPAEPVDVAALIEQHAGARAMRHARDTALLRADGAAAAVERANAQLAEATAALERAKAARNAAQVAHEAALAEVPAEDTVPDIDAIEQRLAAAESVNAAVRQAQERARAQGKLDETKADYDALTAAIENVDETKAAGVAAATMPIDGLAFDDTGVTYRGVPFKQCSSAEQLRVSLAIAMATNPRIRVVRITDGSLLDSENMRLIEEMAAEKDYQVWIERVDETGKVGVVIEDGQVKA